MGGIEGQQPGGTETFILLTDIARSSWLTEAYPQQYYAALTAHNAIVERTVAAHGGEVLKSLGDGYLALFDAAANAVEAAVALQLALSAGAAGGIEEFPDGSKLGVRAVVHGGPLTRLAGQDLDWYGPALNRSSRIGKVCHPGQLLISGVVREALPALPSELAELDLGRVRLRDLGEPEHLYQLTHPGFAQRQFPPLMDLNSRPNNLAGQPNTFIGRDQELAELSRLLAGDSRLLTLHAHGGYGKSRLASQLCAHLLWRFEHGAFEALLAPVRDHRQLPEAIAAATGFQFFDDREPRQQVLDYLRNKELLLCLDNFEHLLDGADFVAEILKTAPKVRILVTSREPLRLTAEHVYPLAPLPLGPGSDSVLLYADRAARVRHSFALTAETAPWVERICERLEGIPLSIELCAAWADSFTLDQLYAELERQLEVTARMRDVPLRQRSVRASCDWSYGLLKPELQRALRRLSVCHGGFCADAAAAVLELAEPAVHQVLTALGDKSWLFTREEQWTIIDSTATSIRYYLRDAASQEYAMQLLNAPANAADHAQATAAHLRHYAQLLAREAPLLRGAGTPDSGRAQVAALKQIGIERSNIAAAFERALKVGELEWLLPIARHLWRLHDMTGGFKAMLEEYGLLQETARGLGNAELEMYSQIGLARARYCLGDWSAARDAASAADGLAATLGDRPAQAQAKVNLASVESRRGNFGVARALIDKAVALRRELDDVQGEASALYNLGKVESAQGDLSSALKLIERALALQREAGDRYGEASSLFNLGIIGLMQGDCSSARALFEQATNLQQELGDRAGEAQSRSNLGNVEGTLGNYSAAKEHFAQALALQQELGDRPGEAYSLVNLGAVERARGDDDAARELYRQALQLARSMGDTTLASYCLHELGSLELKQGSSGAARGLLAEAMAIRRAIGDQSRIGETLAAAGALLAAAGQLPSAAIAQFGAQHLMERLGASFGPAEHELLEQGLAVIEHSAAGLPPVERQRLQARAQAMSVDELTQFALDSLEQVSEAPDNGGMQAGN